ncbi:hypothetical protein NOR53_2097 [gamma proteobacterium NOR5-3]|nr:hypothetical protein NOR53_2097 [gamma proteobacterium NOR5-3]
MAQCPGCRNCQAPQTVIAVGATQARLKKTAFLPPGIIKHLIPGNSENNPDLNQESTASDC